MAFTPSKSPLYGGGPLTVRLDKDPQLNPSLPFFVIFEGSRRRHAVSSHYSDSSGLFCTQIPGHDHEEEVQVSLVQLCSETYEGLGTYSILTQGQLNYECDTTFYLARFLTSSVYNDHALDNLELIKSDHFDLSNEVQSTLDARLNLALRNANLSPNWHLLGGDSLSDAVCEKRETLLHFCARIGLIQVANFLLEQPGSEDALRLPNRHGELPYNIAHQNGFHELAEMLSGYNTQGLRHTPHPEVVDIDHGVVRILDDGNISISSYLDNPNMERSIENEIDFLRETEKMIRMQRGITHQQNYNTGWPEDPRTHFPDGSQPSSALEQEMEQSMQRLLKNQQLHGQTLQGLLNCSQNNSIEVRRLDDESSDLAITEEAYPVLENSRGGVHDLCENLFQLREKSQKAKQTQAIRKKHLTRFSSSCPSLIQPVLHRSLSSVSEKEDEQTAMLEENRVPGQMNETLSAWQSFPPSITQGNSSYTDDSFDPRVHIRLNGVTLDSSETQGRDIRNSAPVELYARKSWDGTDQMEVSEISSLAPAIPHGPHDVGDGIEPVCLKRRSLSLSNLDEDEDVDDDDDDEEEEFRLRLDSTKQQSLDESPKARGPLFSTLSLTNDPVGEDDSTSPCSSPKSKEMPDGKMIPGRGLSPYNAKSLQDLASPEAAKDLAVMSTSPIRLHMFEDATNITKSLSTPSIPQATELTGDYIRERRNGKNQGENVYRDFLEDYDLFRRQKEIEELEEEDMPENKSGMTLKDFLNEEHSPNDSDEKSGKTGRKEEKDKRRKPSVFSRFQSSYRTKKSKGKEVKNKEGHNFVSVSFSNSTPCDACHKPLANKAALRCQTCLLNVHESGCKDQLICERRTSFKVLPRESARYVNNAPAPPQVAWSDQQLPSGAPLAGAHSRPSIPIKERKSSAPGHMKTSQVPPPLPLSHRYSLPTASLFGSPPDSPLGAAQWSSQNSNRFSLYDKAISEEIECESASTLEASNIGEAISESLESLDSDGLMIMPALEGELDVNLLVEEPEAWSITVDKRTLKKLSTKDIKRQDTIWELIQTERQYVKRLRIMQKIFAKNMINELNYSREQVDRLFPHIDDLVDLHLGFLKEMLALQSKSEDRYIDEIGFLLVSQFQDPTGDKMKSAYGVFCSKHTEAMQLYKEFIKVDRKFQNFAKHCSNLSICEKRDISDFILGVTVRLSKYPILIEAILKSTKDKKDRENLSIALLSSKDVVQHVDEKVAAYEKLVDIQSKMESRAVMYRGKKFKRQDLTADGRELIHAGKLGWKTARGRVYDVLAVVLTDVIVFLQISEQKFAFFQDNKSSVIPLYRLLVREKNDEKDSIGIYMISSTPEMYELMCQSRVEREGWIRLLQDAIRSCPPEIETQRPVIQPALPSEEDKKKEEQVASQIKEIIEQLHHQDSKIKVCCDEKNRLIQELMGVSTTDTDNRPQSNVQEVTSDIESLEIMQAAMQEASRLTTILHGTESHLSRSVSSVGEHVSDSYVATAMPKRAETFAGFDTTYELQSSEMSAIQPPQANPEQALQVPEEERRPSGDYSVDESTTSLLENTFSSKDLSSSAEPQPQRTSPSPPKQSAGVLLRQAHTTLDNSSNIGSQSELSVSPYLPSSSSGEHMTSIVHLVQYLNALMNVTCKQNTKVESLQAELEEAKRQIAKLSADMHGRRTVYGHDQLEELRNVQENINRERQEWERTKSKDKTALDKERGKLEAEKLNLEKEKRDLHNKREDFKREKEALQRQIDMMRAQGYHISSNIVEEKPDVPDHGNHSKSNGKKLLQDSKKFVSHQRSASADLSHAAAKDMEIMHNRQASDQLATGGTAHYRQARLSDGSLTQAKHILPVHLLSARNEQRMGGVNVQHLPYKLAGSNSTAASSHSSHQHPSYVKSSQSFLKQPGRAGSTDIKRVQSMSASPRSASGQSGSHNSPRASDLSGLMKLADPKSKSVGSTGSATSGGSGHKGSSSSSGSTTKSKSGSKGGSSDGVIFF